MGGPANSAEIIDAEVIEEIVKTQQIEKVIEDMEEMKKKEVGIISPGMTVDSLAQEAQQKILKAEEDFVTPKQAPQTIQLPGNRKDRRKLMKKLKIPKEACTVATKDVSEAYTENCHKRENCFTVAELEAEAEEARKKAEAEKAEADKISSESYPESIDIVDENSTEIIARVQEGARDASKITAEEADDLIKAAIE